MIKIIKVTKHNSSFINTIDNAFHVTQRIVPQIDKNGVLDFELQVIDPPFTKKYRDHDITPTLYEHDPDYAAYLAFVKGILAGQILLQRYWNELVSIEDIRVSSDCRRMGVGKALVIQAKKWAIDCKLKGLRLETQDINSGACVFYQSCGFRLKGFDSCLYAGIPDCKDEIALYWYLLVEESDDAL